MLRRRATLAIAAVALLGGIALADQRDPRLDPLFAALRGAQDPHAAAGIEGRIWEIWLLSGDEETDRRMLVGIRAMNAGDFDTAESAFDAIVRNRPTFAEGWNKRATLYFLMGRPQDSIDDIDRTLALEPRHFGALSGLALIRGAQGKPFEALEALEQVTKIHPKLPHLQERVDRLTAQLGVAI